MPLSKKLFYLLLFLLPLNLGKHFILDISFVNGVLVDYLIPTLYIQDLLVILILCFYFYENRNSTKSLKELLLRLFFNKKFTILYFFLFSVLLSSLISSLPVISLLSFLRLFIYFFLFIYISNNIKISEELSKISNILILSVSLISILGIFQFIHKGSIFDNYLFFGEQPYSFSTYGIHKENIFGFSIVPAYGLFRHPNIFAGVLSIVLLINIFKIRKYGLTRYPLVVSILLIIIALILTFSISAYFSLFLVFISYLILMILKNLQIKFSLNLGFIFFTLFFLCLIAFSTYLFSSTYFLGNFTGTSLSESFIRRLYLKDATLNLIQDNFLYGAGISMFTKELENYVTYVNDIRFLQPVHNVFLLVLSETGLISFIFFILLLLVSMYRLLKVFYFPPKELYIVINSISLLLIVLLLLLSYLFLFDHYFWTIHQTMLLFWIVLGLCWTNDLDY